MSSMSSMFTLSRFWFCWFKRLLIAHNFDLGSYYKTTYMFNAWANEILSTHQILNFLCPIPTRLTPNENAPLSIYSLPVHKLSVASLCCVTAIHFLFVFKVVFKAITSSLLIIKLYNAFSFSNHALYAWNEVCLAHYSVTLLLKQILFLCGCGLYFWLDFIPLSFSFFSSFFVFFFFSTKIFSLCPSLFLPLSLYSSLSLTRSGSPSISHPSLFPFTVNQISTSSQWKQFEQCNIWIKSIEKRRKHKYWKHSIWSLFWIKQNRFPGNAVFKSLRASFALPSFHQMFYLN